MKSRQLLTVFVLSGAMAFCARAETKHHWNPDVTAAADGFYYVTWFNRTDANIQLQKISVAGVVQWTNSVQVNTISITYPSGWEPQPQIAVAGGYLYVVWGRGFQELRMMKLDTSGNRIWGTEVKVNSQSSETLGYDLAADSSGYLYVHYQRYGPEGRASFLAKIDSSGNKVWTNDVTSGQGSNQWDQRLAISANNAIYTINAYRIDPSTTSTWLRRLNTAGATIWDSVDVGLSNAGLTTDASGNVIVSGTVGTNRVYMKRYDPDGNQIGTTATVTVSARLPVNSGAAVDGDGSIFIIWEDRRGNYGYDYEVYANRINSAGERLWSADHNVNGIDLAEQQHSRAVPHPCGGLMVVWDQDTPGGGWVNILANRIDASGARSFAADVNLHAFGVPDVDGDGMADSWEARYFDSSLDCAATNDTDNDGVSNYREYVADTVPTNRQSLFTIDLPPTFPPSVRFDSSSARSYSLESATNLAPPITWTPVGDAVAGNGSAMSLTDAGAGSLLYYRVKVHVP